MMDRSSLPGLVKSSEMMMPGNLEILAQTAASQSYDDSSPYSGFPILRLSENVHVSLLSRQIQIEDQPGGPMFSQAQIHKLLNSSEHEEGQSHHGPLSIITTTSFGDTGQHSPVALSQGSQMMQHYRSRSTSGDAMLSAINYSENDNILQDGGFDMGGNLGNLDDGLLSGRLTEHTTGDAFGLFDDEGDSLNMENLSPGGLMIADTGGLNPVNAISDSCDSNIAGHTNKDTDGKKLQVSGKPRAKNNKNQLSPGKGASLECNQCHKIFNNTSALAKHKLTHSDERKYLCTICEKKFKRQDHLNGHLMTHRDKKPYQCVVGGCEKSYCDARSLKRHLENHHQHTSEQIAQEMVAASTSANEMLSKASNSMPAQVTQKAHCHQAANKSSVITPVTLTNATKTLSKENTILAQTLMNAGQFSEIDMQTIAAQLQKEQQQHSGTSSGTSPASWHSQQTVKSETSHTQSPRSGDQSPGYSEMSPSNHQGLPSSPNQSLAPAWYISTSQAQQVTAAPNTSVLDVKSGDDPNKQVVCSICQRRFKNVPALNGHMRLHGGYFKKDSALKEEKKKKEMAPPFNVPSRPNSTLGPVQQSLPAKKAKDTPPLQSPPSEELHALHWQQKQEQQFQQQLQHELQQHQKQQQKSNLDIHIQSSSPQLVQENLNQIRQKILLQQQQQQQEQQLQQQQLQLMQQQQQQQAHLEQRQQEQQEAMLSSFDLLQLANLQQPELDQQQLEQIKVHLHQLQIQQQLQQQQNHEEQQQQQHFLFDNPHTHISTQQPSNMYLTNHLPQSPHLPNSPTYSHTGSVSQSSHVSQSNLVQHQGSLEPVHTPATAEYGNPSVLIPTIEDMQPYGDSNLVQDMSDYEVLHGSDEVILQNFHQQLQSQGLCVDNVQDFHVSLQNVNIGSDLSNHSLTACDSDNINTQLHQLTFNSATDVHTDQSAFDSQLSGPFGPLDHSDGSAEGSSHTASEIVSQIITSLENLGEVPRGSMQQIHEHKGDQDLHIPKVYPGNSQKYYQHSPMDNETDVFVKNSFRDMAHDSIVHNSNSVSSYTMPVVSQHVTPLIDSRTSVKHELLKHLTSKPSSPRAAQNTQMSFQNIPINSLNSCSFTNTIAQRQRHHSVKSDIPSSLVLMPKPQLNSELKRRLSAGPEDIRAHIYSFSNSSDQSREKLLGTYIKPALFRSDDMLRPRMRSKSGDDFRMIRFENEDTFMKPMEMSDGFIRRPRSKTDEHLPKWRNNEGEGIFRNPSSFAPGSFKMRRKNRPAPLFIPPHASMCGFQSRLRSPRISLEADGANTAPVPYTPPPMLSPVRRGAGLFCALQSSFTPQSTHSSGPPLSTPRPSLLRSASVSKSDDDTIPFVQEEQPPPESDIQPHVNVGPQYQAALPDFNPNIHLALSDVSKEDLVFDPACLRDNTEEDVQSYQELACSAVVAGNGINVEHALHLLHIANGNIQKALLMLMTGSCRFPQSHTLTSYKYQESDIWSSVEIDNYTKAILKFDKDFFKIAMEVKTKNVRQCIQFYYLWKKVLVDDHKRLRAIRKRREQDYNLRSTRRQALAPEEAVSDEGTKVSETAPMEDGELDARELMGDEDDSLSEASTSVGAFEEHAEKFVEGEEKMGAPVEAMNVKTTCAPSIFACTYPECNSKFSSKAALNAHHKIHVRVTRPPPTLSSVFETTTPPSRSPVHSNETSSEEVFPCKLCGRVFGKVKSRSAHMKIHRPDQDKEREKKAKLAKQAAAAAAASMEQSFINPFRYSALANGSSQI